MTNLDDLKNYVQDNLTRVLAIAMIALCAVGVAIFAITNVLPAWQAHNELAAQVVSAQDSLQAQQQAGLNSGDVLRRQAEAMQTKVAQQAVVFLSEKEAAQVLANLYGYARDSGAQVVDLQAQPAPKTDAPKANATASTVSAPQPYVVRVFRLTVSGEADALVEFMARFREAALPGVSLSNLKVGAGKDGATTLVVDVTMYTSPFASGTVLAEQTGPTPPPLPTLEGMMPSQGTLPSQGALATVALVAPTGTPAAPTTQPSAAPSGVPGASPAAQTATPTSTPAATVMDSAAATATPTLAGTSSSVVQALLVELDKQWAAQDWPAIIATSQQILALDPTTAGLSVKLYTAHTNYGYQLASQGKTEQAKAEFTAALSINPDGAAALAGLKMLANGSATAAPPVTIYVVQWGDTLANLAIHFNVSVQAIKSANHLIDDRIYAGQELIIPG